MSRSDERGRRFWLSSGIATLVLSALAAARAQDLPNYHVLAIGINTYKDALVPNLRGAIHDADRIATLFVDQGPRVRVTKLRDDQATGWDIQEALRRLEDEARPNDLVVVFFSGHGGRNHGDWSFLPSDHFVMGRGDRKVNFIPGIPVTAFNILLPIERLIERGHRVLLAVDACQAGQLALEAFSNPALRKEGLILMASSVPGQFSRDSADNGLFTKALSEALEGQADQDGDRVVTLKEVKLYLFWRMPELLSQQPKMPGIAWPEQDCVCQSSLSIPDTFALARVQGAKPRALPAAAPALRGDPPVASGPSPVGLWKMVQTLRGADGRILVDEKGRPLQQVYELVLREDRTYAAMLQPVVGQAQITAGEYLYEPNSFLNFYEPNGFLPPGAQVGVNAHPSPCSTRMAGISSGSAP